MRCRRGSTDCALARPSQPRPAKRPSALSRSGSSRPTRKSSAITPLELPTITFDKTYLLKDPAFDLHLEFHGQAHTAGDIFVFCPQQRVVATGDASHGWLPNIGDGYPRRWPKTIDEVAQTDFKYILGGHGPMQPDRTVDDEPAQLY